MTVDSDGASVRILQFTNCLGHAGAERVVQLLASELTKRGHQLLAVSLLPPMASRLVDILDDSGIPHAYLDVTKRRPLGVLRFRRMIREFEPDVVHAHLFHSHIVARLTAAMFRSRSWPLVNTLHSMSYGPGREWYFGIDRRTLPLCDVQTAVSGAVARYHARRLQVDPSCFPVVYNGIELPQPLTTSEIRAERRRWGMASHDRIIGSVGRLDVAKGYDLLIRAAEHIDRRIPEGRRWGLVIIGEGDQRERLEDLLARQRLRRLDVLLPGFRGDADRAMGAFDLFVMPSRFEGFGMTLAEAMGHGLPALTSGLEPLRELMAQYDRGLCWGAGVGPVDLADLIGGWAHVDRTKPLSVFSASQMADRYLEVYQSARAARASRPWGGLARRRTAP